MIEKCRTTYVGKVKNSFKKLLTGTSSYLKFGLALSIRRRKVDYFVLVGYRNRSFPLAKFSFSPGRGT